MQSSLINASYLLASVCFILALQGLSSPRYARKGIAIGALGMAVAVAATLFHRAIVSYTWIVPGLIIGALIGVAMSIWIPMTKMPERIAFSHAFGGLAAALVGISEYVHHGRELSIVVRCALGLEVFLGSLTFTGSFMAFGKLQGFISGAPITYKGQNASNIGLFIASSLMVVMFVLEPHRYELFYALSITGFVLGVLAVLPIGGADMPVIVSLLNSYAGLAAAATGFALSNNVLIIAGALDGTSGFLLSMMMSKAMNRSFANVLFGAFGTGDLGAQAELPKSSAQVNVASEEDAVSVLSAGQSVIVIPGYGMAVSQAQHAVRELAELLESRGATIRYAIHPVAGRMPGHMNVLLAEANIPYDQLFDLDDINDDFARTDVVLVIGANDVVNPAAKKNPRSPIYGMPVFNVELARSVMVLKRSMNPGFAGIENELFIQPNTMMLLGDAKKTLANLVGALKHAH